MLMPESLDDFVAPRYRSAGRRPEGRNDRRAAADAPLALLRGIVSGALGAPGDIESLVRLLPYLSNETVLPTSDDVEKRLPLKSVSDTPVGRAFTEVGKVGGGGYMGPGSPLRAISTLPSAVSRAAGDFAVAAGGSGPSMVEQKMLQGLYRGYAGDYNAGKAADESGLVYATPQRRAAEAYAKSRSGQAERRGSDATPHLEMIMIDPASGRRYGHSTMGSGSSEPLRTLAAELHPEDIKSVTQLYASGGQVQPPSTDYDPAQVDALVNQLRTELAF